MAEEDFKVGIARLQVYLEELPDGSWRGALAWHVDTPQLFNNRGHFAAEGITYKRTEEALQKRWEEFVNKEYDGYEIHTLWESTVECEWRTESVLAGKTERMELEKILSEYIGLRDNRKGGECLSCCCKLDTSSTYCSVCKFDGWEEKGLLCEEILRLREPRLEKVRRPYFPELSLAQMTPKAKKEKDLGELPDGWEWKLDMDGQWSARNEEQAVFIHEGSEPPDGTIAVTLRKDPGMTLSDFQRSARAQYQVFLEVIRANGYL